MRIKDLQIQVVSDNAPVYIVKGMQIFLFTSGHIRNGRFHPNRNGNRRLPSTNSFVPTLDAAQAMVKMQAQASLKRLDAALQRQRGKRLQLKGILIHGVEVQRITT